MTSAVWFGIGMFLGIAMGGALFWEYKATITAWATSLDAKYERIVTIISHWQKDVVKK